MNNVIVIRGVNDHYKWVNGDVIWTRHVCFPVGWVIAMMCKSKDMTRCVYEDFEVLSSVGISHA